MSSREHLLRLLRQDRIDKVIKDLRHYVSDYPIEQTELYASLLTQYDQLRAFKTSGTEWKREVNNLKRAFVTTMDSFLCRNISEEPWQETLNEIDFNLSLPDLKRKLLEILRQNGLSALVAFSRNLLYNADLVKRLGEVENTAGKIDFQHGERMRQITYDATESTGFEAAVRLQELTKEKKRKLDTSAMRIINELEDEDLVTRWKVAFRNTRANFSWHSSTAERQLLLSPLEMIQVPAYLSKERGDYLQYKRLMVQAQDAYLAHRYAEAYDLFLRVRNEVDPESAQLYELLLVTYFKKHRGPLLIDSYLTSVTKEANPNEKDNPLHQLYLYANRFHLLQGNHEPGVSSLSRSAEKGVKKPGSDLIAQPARPIFSYTGEQNIKTIAEQLLLRLAERQTKITDQVVSGVTSREKARIELWRCITTARDIYQFLQPDHIVFTAIISELFGAGANFWITVDDMGQPANVHPGFDALGQFHAIVGMVASEKHQNLQRKSTSLALAENKTLEQLTAEITADLAALVSDGLRVKYEGLPLAPTPTPDEAAATYQPYVELMLSYRAADALLPESGLFFEVPFLEVGNGEGKVDWFQLGRGRRLYTRFTAPDFDALAYFEDLCRRKDLSHGTITVGSAMEHLIQMYYVRLSDKTFELYRTINLTGEFDLAKAGRQRIAETSFCYRNWQICFDVNEDESYLKLCHDEVVGNGILFWWAIGRHGLNANSSNPAHNIFFDAREELAWLNDSCGVNDSTTDYQTIAENYLNRIAIPVANEIGKRTVNQLNPCAEDHIVILGLVEKVIQLTSVVGPLSPLEDFVYDELIQEKTFRWYDLQGEHFVNEAGIVKDGIDAIPLLEEAQMAFAASNRFATEHLQDMTSLHREDDIITSYQEDFSRNQQYNYDEDTIILFVTMIERLIGYHKITGNAKLLAMPYEELVTGKGKVRWARYPWTVFAIDKVLSVEKDEYGRPAHIGVKRWQIIRGRIHPRPRVRKVSHFDFRDAYFYVKYNYEADAMIV